MKLAVRLGAIFAMVLGFSTFGLPRVAAAGLCAAPGGAGGCYSTIQAAVDAASAGDTVTVRSGTYTEAVSITKGITLQGSGSAVIDATGLVTGITIANTSGVTVSNFTIENAGDLGIDVESSSKVTISGNSLLQDDKNANPDGSCSGPAMPDEDQCGNGVFLNGVTNSTIAGNTSENNVYGVVLTDDSGPSSGNTISGGTFTHNLQCGIVIASHNPKAPNGIFNNVIKDNFSSYNHASGVGVFGSGPGTDTHNNVVDGNTLIDNWHGGVTLHVHAPGVTNNDNQITNNFLSNDNIAGDDSAGDSLTTGIILASAAQPITGTVITGNTISNVAIGIFLGNTANTTLSDNTISATVAPVMTVPAGAIPNPGSKPTSGVTATPYVWPTTGGLSSAFAVSFATAGAAQGKVLFGTSCSGLTMTATQDQFAGTTQHWVLVSRDDLSSSGIGLTPGTTYYYEVVSVTSGRVTTDNNGGACYKVTIPTAANSTAAPMPPAPSTSA
ncbi:MAG: NosD domain-containing protein [Chloroflexota bacterium]